MSVKGARFYCLPSTAVSLRTGCRAGTSTPTCSWVHTSCTDTRPGVRVRVIPGASWYVHTWPHFVSPETGSESRIWGQVVYLGGDQGGAAAGRQCQGRRGCSGLESGYAVFHSTAVQPQAALTQRPGRKGRSWQPAAHTGQRMSVRPCSPAGTHQRHVGCVLTRMHLCLRHAKAGHMG